MGQRKVETDGNYDYSKIRSTRSARYIYIRVEATYRKFHVLVHLVVVALPSATAATSAASIVVVVVGCHWFVVALW
jgi:hypothetical protein